MIHALKTNCWNRAMQVLFLLKHDPQALEEIMKFEWSILSSITNNQGEERNTFNAFAGMQLVRIFPMNRLRLIKQQSNLQKKSSTQGSQGKEVCILNIGRVVSKEWCRTNNVKKQIKTDRRFRDFSRICRCKIWNSFRHDEIPQIIYRFYRDWLVCGEPTRSPLAILKDKSDVPD